MTVEITYTRNGIDYRWVVPVGDEPALDVADAAYQLSLGRSRIYSLLMSGELESVKIGRSRRITRKALDQFLENLNTVDADIALSGND